MSTEGFVNRKHTHIYEISLYKNILNKTIFVVLIQRLFLAEQNKITLIFTESYIFSQRTIIVLNITWHIIMLTRNVGKNYHLNYSGQTQKSQHY